MTMTLDLPASVLQEAMRRADTQSPEEAVAKALGPHTRPRSQADLIPLLGTFEDMMTPAELDVMRRDE